MAKTTGRCLAFHICDKRTVSLRRKSQYSKYIKRTKWRCFRDIRLPGVIMKASYADVLLEHPYRSPAHILFYLWNENNKLIAKYCYANQYRSVSKVNKYLLAEQEFVSKVNSIVWFVLGFTVVYMWSEYGTGIGLHPHEYLMNFTSNNTKSQWPIIPDNEDSQQLFSMLKLSDLIDK